MSTDRPMLCDEDGVPRLVQHIRYDGGLRAWHATLFDGRKFALTAESMGNLTPTLFPKWKEEAYLDAYELIEDYARHQFTNLRQTLNYEYEPNPTIPR